jgi:peptidyl-prolyl cis-trans isomerase D
MLLQMRSFTRSWVSYVLLFILAALFVLLLGNGQSVMSALQTSGSNNIAEVSHRAITRQAMAREFDQTLRRARAQGGNFTQAEAIERGLHMQVLERIIQREAMFAFAEQMGVVPSLHMVGEEIRSTPAFTSGVAGRFDRETYADVLRQEGFTEPEFERQITGSIGATMLMESLTAGVRAPSSFGALALTYERETRVVSIAEAPASLVGNVLPPTTAQLQTFYEENQEQLRLPEFRALTLVYARAQDFVARVDVPDERLHEEFEHRRAALTQPERRTYVRISTESEAQANDARARLARGEAPAAIATALSVQTSRGEHQARTEVPDARVADAVFSMQPGAPPQVVHGELGPWAVVKVESITPAVEPDFASQREELRQAIAADEAADQLNAAVSAFEEARAAGTAVADAARQAGLTVTTVPPVDAQGRGQGGQPAEAVTGQTELLAAAFRTPEGEASDFMPVGQADVVVAVDRIIPSSVRPLDAVRTDLTSAWISRERMRRLRELGDQAVADINGGQTLAAVSRARHMRVVVSSRAISRAEAAQIPARGLPGQIFGGREGAAISDMQSDGQALLVAVVEHINRVDTAAVPQEVEARRAQFQQGLIGSFGETLQAEIVRRGHPTQNQRVINQLYPREGQADAAQ